MPRWGGIGLGAERRSMSRGTLRWWLTLLGLLLLIGCPAAPQLAPVPQGGTILAFGDSLTFGTGASPETSYPSVVQRLSGYRVINAGVPGETTEGGLARLPEVLQQEQPSLVILCLGGNDFLRRLDEGKTEQNLRDMVMMIRERGIGVVLIGVPRLGFGLEVPVWYRKIAGEAQIPYEGKVLKRILADRALKADPIHPNPAGYQHMAEAVVTVLKKSGAIR